MRERLLAVAIASMACLAPLRIPRMMDAVALHIESTISLNCSIRDACLSHMRVGLQPVPCSARLGVLQKTERSYRVPLSCRRKNALVPRSMATTTEQLNPTQLFKRQWESYQVVGAAIRRVPAGIPWKGLQLSSGLLDLQMNL